MTYEELIKQYETFDKEKLAAATRELFFKIASGVGEMSNDKDFGLNFAMVILANTIAQDGTLGNPEWALFSYILQEDCNRDDVVNFLKQYHDAELVQEVKKIAGVNPALGHDIVQLTLAVAAIDGNVSPDEHHLIKYLMDI